jgi:hypothetical protein
MITGSGRQRKGLIKANRWGINFGKDSRNTEKEQHIMYLLFKSPLWQRGLGGFDLPLERV